MALGANEFLGVTAEGWAAVGSIGTLLAVLLGHFTLWRGRVSEIRRTQPIVIAHASGDRRFAEAGEVGLQVLDTWLRNEGEGTAFNVRFGIEYAGVRFPWKFAEEDPETVADSESSGRGVSFPALIGAMRSRFRWRVLRSGRTQTKAASTGAATKTQRARHGRPRIRGGAAAT
jgi:hypothetical protein